MGNLISIHVKLDQHAENCRIEVSGYCSMDEIVHDPAEWVLNEEDQVEANEV